MATWSELETRLGELVSRKRDLWSRREVVEHHMQQLQGEWDGLTEELRGVIREIYEIREEMESFSVVGVGPIAGEMSVAPASASVASVFRVEECTVAVKQGEQDIKLTDEEVDHGS